MTPEVITAMCAGIATIITAVGAVIINAKLNSIHGLVNSRLTKALEEIALLKNALNAEREV